MIDGAFEDFNGQLIGNEPLIESKLNDVNELLKFVDDNDWTAYLPIINQIVASAIPM